MIYQVLNNNLSNTLISCLTSINGGGQNLVIDFTFDSTLATFDSEILTFDFE